MTDKSISIVRRTPAFLALLAALLALPACGGDTAPADEHKEEAGHKDEHAEGELPQGAAEDAKQQLPRRRPQGRADADLARALRDRERHHRLDTGSREQQDAHGDDGDRPGDPAPHGAKLVVEVR